MKLATLITALLLAAATSPPATALEFSAAASAAATSAMASASAAATTGSGAASAAATAPQDPKKASNGAPPASLPASLPASSPASAPVTTRATTQGTKLYAPASQLVNAPLQIMVSPDLPEGADPKLSLLVGNRPLDPPGTGCGGFDARALSRNQTWVGGADTEGATTQHVGTLVLFDLPDRCQLDAAKPMTRVRPIVTWTVPGQTCTDCQLVGTSLVSLGNATTAFIESLVAVVLGVLLIVAVARMGRLHKLVQFFYSVDDGKLSLSMLQMALWTLAAVLMVIFEDLLRLDTPTVPSSIVVLMGMSLLTTGASYHLTANPPSGAAPAAAPPGVPRHTTTLSDLLSVPDANGVMQLSLSRAQMLLWTLVIVVLFIAKSAINQSLWDIPWPLVALMGVSQAGYLGGKFSQ